MRWWNKSRPINYTSSPTGPLHGPSGGDAVVVKGLGLVCTTFTRPAAPVAPCLPLSPVAPATIKRHVQSVIYCVSK